MSRKEKQGRNYENVNKGCFLTAGEYNIPILAPVEYRQCEWVGFNYASSVKDRRGKGIHFFLEDYQFTRLWGNIDYYVPMLSSYDSIMTPDFSLYTDFPIALQIYNHYRKHWIGAYLQQMGCHVVPTICWSDRESFRWCFDGEPTQGVVAVSSVGTQNSKKRREMFLEGYIEMMDRLQPTHVIFYGTVPEECGGDIVRIKAFSERFHEAEISQW